MEKNSSPWDQNFNQAHNIYQQTLLERRQCHDKSRQFCHQVFLLTPVGTVSMSLVTIVSTVIVPITGPVFWDAAPTVTFKLDTGTGMAAACFIAVIPTVVV